MKRIIFLSLLSCLALLIFFFVIDKPQEVSWLEKETIKTEFGTQYTALIYNNTELTDHRYIISEDLCEAYNLGMNISIYPCLTRVFNTEDIENYVNFHWQGEVEQETSWVFVYEGELESGEMMLGHDEVVQTARPENQETWVEDYVITGVVDFQDLGIPTIEGCELGTENNSYMYLATQQNDSGTFDTTYCFSAYEQINDTTFSLDGNASINVIVYEEGITTIYDIPVEVEYLGYNLLGNGFSFYQVLDVNFEPDTTYKTKWSFTPLNHAPQGKWHIFGYNADYTLEESLDLGQYVYVDPSWTNDFNEGLVAYYYMNDTTGNGTDEIFADNNFTIFSNVTRGADGLINRAYKFNGTSSADVTDIQSMNSTNGTVSFWFNWSDPSPGAAYQFLQGFWNPPGETDWIYVVLDNGVAQNLRVQGQVGGGVPEWGVEYDITKIERGKWHHLAYTQNGTGVSLYLNGTKVDSSTGTAQNYWLSNMISSVDTLRIGGYTTAVGYSFNGSIDELGIWNRSLTATEISDLYNDGNGISYIPNISEGIKTNLIYPSDNFKIFSSTINFTATFVPFSVNLTNATLYIWKNNLFNYSATNKVSGGVINQTNFTVFLNRGNYIWNVFGCGNSSNNTIYCNFASSNFSLLLSFSENNFSYNTTTFSSSIESFILNTTLGTLNSSSAIFYYNNTAYASTKTTQGSNTFFGNTITVPAVAYQENKTFYWTLNLEGNLYNTSSNNQSVNALILDDCTTYPYQILNFSLYDEDSRTRTNGTIEIKVNLLNSDRTFNVASFNQTYYINDTNAKTATVCFSNINSTMSLDYQTKYFSNVSDYTTEYKFADAISINNNTQTQHIPLYDLLDSRSTAFTIILENPDLSVLDGAIVDVQRQYIPINQFISVESPKTNSLGEAIAHLVHNEIYYNFIVTKDGVLLGTFNNYLVQCQNFVTGDCRIYLNLIESTPTIPEFDEYGNITGVFVWSPTTRNLLFDFIAIDGIIHNVSLNVKKLDNWGNNTICLNELTAASGTLSCTVPVLWGNSTLLARVYSDGEFLGSNYFSLNPSAESIWGGTRIILGILMYATLALMMIANPVTIILGAIFGMIFVVSFGILDGGTLFGSGLIIFWFILAGGILIYYMRNKV